MSNVLYMAKKSWLLAVLVICSVSALGQGFTLHVEPIQDSIYATDPGSRGVFDLFIRNNLPYEDRFQIRIGDDTRWTVEFRPDSHLIRFPVGPGQTSTTRMLVRPTTSNLAYGQYNLSLTVRSDNSSQEKSAGLLIFLKDPGILIDRTYLPSLVIDVDSPQQMDPRDSRIMTVSVENRNPLNISDLVISVSSSVNSLIDNSINTTLGPLEKKRVTFKIAYKDTQEPVQDIIKINVEIPSKNKKFDTLMRSVEVIGYSELKETSLPSKSFLMSYDRREYFNDGNIRRSERVRVPTTLFSQFFTSAEPEARSMKENGQRYLYWNLELAPQEKAKIIITTNYRPLFWSVVLIAAIIIIYLVFRSPITVRKASREVKTTKEQQQEGLSDIKIILHVKNRTNNVVEDVSVIDKVPSIIDPQKEITAGTLHPTKIIKHQKKGILLKWELDSLEPFEERIITYDIVSKLKIIGPILMPSAYVRFKNRFSRHSRVYSNKLYVGGVIK